MSSTFSIYSELPCLDEILVQRDKIPNSLCYNQGVDGELI